MTREPTIVSLLASATEIVSELGLRHRLIGRSHECDFPPDVAELPVLSEPKIDPGRSSKDIDTQVRTIARDGLSVYRIDVEALERLKPDLVVTQDQCEVCAVSLDDVRDAVCQMTGIDTEICTLHPENLDDVYADFQRVADAAGVSARGSALADSVRNRLQLLERRSSRVGTRPRVAMIEWLDPVMVAGGWIPELVHAAGGEPVIVESPRTFQTVSWDDVAAADPDVVVILPCGFEMARSLAELEQEHLAAAVNGVPAIAEGRGFVVDGNSYFNRPGPRLADSAEILAAILHPVAFPDVRGRYPRPTPIPGSRDK